MLSEDLVGIFTSFKWFQRPEKLCMPLKKTVNKAYFISLTRTQASHAYLNGDFPPCFDKHTVYANGTNYLMQQM